MSELLSRMIRIVAVAGFTLATLTATAAPPALVASLKPWSPLSVTSHGGTIEIVTPQDRVTDTIYLAVLRGGVCGSLWSNPGNWSGVTEIKVLNRHARQGYVFEGGEDECVELGELSGDESEFYVLGRSRFN